MQACCCTNVQDSDRARGEISLPTLMSFVCGLQLNCHNASANTFVALMGDSKADFKYYGPPELYERYVGGWCHLLLCC